MRDDREFQRIDVSIPCLIYCDDRVITGDIINISLTGACIQASETLAEGSPVVLMLQKKHTKLRAAIESKISHSFQEVRGDDQINSFDVKFEESLSEVSTKLAFILDE